MNTTSLTTALCFAIVAVAGLTPAVSSAALLNVRTLGAVADGVTDNTTVLQNIFSSAHDGDLIILPAGRYAVKPGSMLTIGAKVRISGTGAELVNGRLLILADIVLRGLTISENDCLFTTDNPAACPVTTPLVTIGYKGYPIHKAIIEGLNLAYTRAYTGIAMGYDTVENVMISEVNIKANALSAISIYGGSNINIINGTIQGGDMAVVDDGIAISALYGPISNVQVSGMKAQNIFDLVGIGAEMVYPTSSVSVTSSECDQTAACIYVKLGNDIRLPGVNGAFSTLTGLLVNNIQVNDPEGKRYLTSVWLAAAGGAQGSGLRISNVTTVARCATTTAVGAKFLLTSNSQLSDVTLDRLKISTPDATSTGAGYAPNEGILIQTLGQSTLSNVRLTNGNFSNIGQYAIDSTNGTVSNLTIYATNFDNVSGLQGPALASSFLIPYSYIANDKQIGF